jgi:hypothetical protein
MRQTLKFLPHILPQFFETAHNRVKQLLPKKAYKQWLSMTNEHESSRLKSNSGGHPLRHFLSANSPPCLMSVEIPFGLKGV